MLRQIRFAIVNSLAALAVVAVTPAAFANLGGGDDSAADDANFQEATKAIQAQDWTRALGLLEQAAAAHPDSADAQNLLGYAHRKTGNLDAAFKHYNEALRLNPAHKPAHEYIGEAYLMANDVARAEKHLAELQRLCSPIPCEELKELRRAVNEYKKTKK
ncbi:MAG: tetratricopeptide repeat protein [Burkholderiales bacterium]